MLYSKLIVVAIGHCYQNTEKKKVNVLVSDVKHIIGNYLFPRHINIKRKFWDISQTLNDPGFFVCCHPW